MSRSALLAAAAAVALVALPLTLLGAARADDLTAIYGQILNDPANVELNLQYALIAEGRQEYRKALSAYERVLANNPDNEEAKRGLQRIRRIIEPPLTQTTWETGAKVESNPLRASGGSDTDFFGYGSVRVRDERPINDTRWRTLFGAYGELHGHYTDLNYGTLTIDTGPLIDLDGTMTTFRPAIGGGLAAFDGSFYYADINASGTVEGYLQGAYQWARLRAGYRQYDDAFASDNGVYAELTGRLTRENVFHDNDAASVAPWLRWNSIDGNPAYVSDDFVPGRYVDVGATLEYSKRINEWLSASADFRIGNRQFADVGSGARHDLTLSPGVSLALSNIVGIQTDIRFDWRYEWNDSNDDAYDWRNQSLRVGLVVRR